MCPSTGILGLCKCHLYDTPVLLYFISFFQKAAHHTHCCEPCVFLTIIYLGGSRHIGTLRSYPILKKCLHSLPRFGWTIIYLPRLLTTFGLSPAARARSSRCLSRVSKCQWDTPSPASQVPGWDLDYIPTEAEVKEARRCYFEGSF